MYQGDGTGFHLDRAEAKNLALVTQPLKLGLTSGCEPRGRGFDSPDRFGREIGFPTLGTCFGGGGQVALAPKALAIQYARLAWNTDVKSLWLWLQRSPTWRDLSPHGSSFLHPSWH